MEGGGQGVNSSKQSHLPESIDKSIFRKCIEKVHSRVILEQKHKIL